MNTIFHIDEPAKWPTVLSNIPNYLQAAKAAGAVGQVELLINGPAVADTKTDSTVDLRPLVESGVTVAVCHNAMNSHGITEAQLQPGLSVVPAGVFELAKRQHEGYAYIKP